MTDIKHADRGHAINGPSSLDRRISCTGSRGAEEAITSPDKGSNAAREGTRAHEMLETILRGGNPEGDEPPEMVRGVMDAVSWVERYQLQGYALYVEVAVDPSPILGDPDTWGTSDIVLVKDNHLIIADFKYGHHPVSSIDNPQLLSYAAGALLMFPDATLDTITLAIIQPRVSVGPAISATNLDIAAARDEWSFMAQQLAKGRTSPTFMAGDHCTFCKAKNTCEARLGQWDQDVTQAFTEVVKADEAGASNSVALLSGADLASTMDKIPLLESVISDLKKEAESRIKAGKDVPGYKMIPGRNSRKWILTDEDLRKKFKSMKLSMADFEVIKLGSPAHIEKIDKLSEKQQTNLRKMWEAKPGAAKLVPSSVRGDAIEYDPGSAFEKAADAPEVHSFL